MTTTTTMWRATVLTLFPEMFPGPLGVSLAGRALAAGLWALEACDIREAATDRHRSVDDTPAGGGPGAMAWLDACGRLLPGVMGKPESGSDESFADGLLEYPQFTRPQAFEGRPVPEILLSGDHAKIAAWRRAQAEALTRERRPD